MKIISFFFAALLFLGVSARAEQAPASSTASTPSIKIEIPSDATQVRDVTLMHSTTAQLASEAVLRAARARRWAVLGTDGNLVKIQLVHKGFNTTVWFRCETERVVMFAKSSFTDKGGSTYEQHPERYYDNLVKDIRVFAN